MEMRLGNSIPKEPWQPDAKWTLKVQPYAIAQFYSKVWPGVKVLELNRRMDELANVIDIGGADILLQFSSGVTAFLAQRFRRYDEREYDDFTLRYDRPDGNITEWKKLELAVQHDRFMAGFYAFGLANEDEDGFIRMRILKLRGVVEAILAGELQYEIGYNKDGVSFMVIPFSNIPRHLFVLDYKEAPDWF